MSDTASLDGRHGPPPAEAAKIENRLLGHLGHLTPAEEKSFEDFKGLSTKGGYYTPETENSRASHDDGTLM